MKALVVFFLVFFAGPILWANNNFQKKDTILNESNGVEKKLALSFGVNLVHFFPTEEAQAKDWKTSPLNLGGELLLKYRLNRKLSVLTGANYQHGKISLNHHYYGDRTNFHELTTPVLIEVCKKQISIRSGVYLGKYLDIKRETKGGKNAVDTNKWYNFPVNTNSNDFICDFYLGLQHKAFNSRAPINLELFCKYKLRDSWLNKDISRFMCGLKVKYQL